MTGSYRTIEVERPAPHVRLVRLNRPEASNAFSTEMARELIAAWDDLPADTRAVVLTGAGSRAFCAGADLKERRDMADADWRAQHKIFEAMAYGIMKSPVPVIAAVNGAAFGGGFELILACDFAYAVPEARFALTEVTLGIMPGVGGTQNLVRAVGPARAREIMLTGAPLSAEQALDWGVVNRLCPAETLLETTLETAGRIAANAPLAVAQIRRAIAAAGDLALEDGLAAELDCYDTLVNTEDRVEGIRAFNEKRKPAFKGR